MARTGLDKTDIKKARDALIAQNKNPSVDAVRVALGNTGSKSTIHKYLRELDAEDGGAGARRASLSDALQDLVGRLAAQLQDEATVQIEQIRAESADHQQLHADTLAALRSEFEALGNQARQTETTLQLEQAVHEQTRAALQRETIARHTAEQHVAGLKDRLAENDAHRQSLEEKDKHARQSLEHYRQSVKEQREQDQRQYEQQGQQLQAEIRQLRQSLIVKQDEITRLNQEGARLAADLAHTQRALLEEQATGRQRVHTLDAQLADAAAQAAVLQDRIQAGQVAAAALQAKLDAQQTLSAQLHAYMTPKEAPPDNAQAAA